MQLATFLWSAATTWRTRTCMVFAMPTVHAQSRFLATVPFDFSLGHRSMAAGTYQIGSISEQVNIIRNIATGVAELLIKSTHVQSVEVESAKLVFNKYGNQFFLSQIWKGNSGAGVQLPPSKREKELRLAGSQFSNGPRTVVVAMNLLLGRDESPTRAAPRVCLLVQ